MDINLGLVVRHSFGCVSTPPRTPLLVSGDQVPGSTRGSGRSWLNGRYIL